MTLYVKESVRTLFNIGDPAQMTEFINDLIDNTADESTHPFRSSSIESRARVGE